MTSGEAERGGRESRTPAAELGDLGAMIGVLGSAGVDDLSPAEMIEQLRTLEAVKAAACARQARLAVAVDAAQRAEEEARDVPAARRGRGVAAQIALARRESPTVGSRHLGLARALCGPAPELPHTMALLTRGELSEWRATVVAAETACLDPELRRQVDAELAAQLPSWSDRQVRTEARRAAYRLDPHAVVARGRHAESERYVSLRPAPDTMTLLTAYLPVRDGVACLATLRAAAAAARAAGDERSRGQVMADTLVERLTGLAEAGSAPVEVQLVMSDRSMFGDDEPAYVPDYGPIPAPAARSWIRDNDAQAWVRRVFTDPVSGEANDIDERRRLFPSRLRKLIVARDRFCRTAWCGAPIRHIDHVVDHAAGGPTSLDNGQGACERCNQVKTNPGWRAMVVPDPEGLDRHVVATRTPTGQVYRSTAPPIVPPRIPDDPIRCPTYALDDFDDPNDLEHFSDVGGFHDLDLVEPSLSAEAPSPALEAPSPSPSDEAPSPSLDAPPPPAALVPPDFDRDPGRVSGRDSDRDGGGPALSRAG